MPAHYAPRKFSRSTETKRHRAGRSAPELAERPSSFVSTPHTFHVLTASTVRPPAFRFSCHSYSVCIPFAAAKLRAFPPLPRTLAPEGLNSLAYLFCFDYLTFMVRVAVR